MATDYHTPGAAEKLTIPPEFDSETRRAMMHAVNDERVLNAKTLHEQIGQLCSILRPDGKGISLEKIGKLFAPTKSHSTISRHLQAFLKTPKPPQRPELLTEQQYRILHDKILATIKESGHPSLNDVRCFIEDFFEITPCRYTTSRIIKRIGFKLKKAKPIEEDRYECQLDEIMEYYQKLSELLTEIPCGFCYNLDESGIQRYVDAKDTFLVVPDDFPDEELTFPVYRSCKRITLLHCISTDGTRVKPLFVLPRKTIERDISFYIDINSCCFSSQDNGFLTADLFKLWLYACFFPQLEEKRQKFQYFGPALLIMDGFKGHTKAYEDIKEIFTENNVKVLFIPPHSSDQLQPLDLLGFNLLKLAKNKTQISFQENTSQQTKEIVRILNALEVSSTSTLVIKAWNAAGIFRKDVENFPCDGGIVLQYHYIDVEMAKKIRTHDEENRCRLKSFSEKLIRTNHFDMKRYFQNPGRWTIPSSPEKALATFMRKHRDSFE